MARDSGNGSFNIANITLCASCGPGTSLEASAYWDDCGLDQLLFGEWPFGAGCKARLIPDVNTAPDDWPCLEDVLREASLQTAGGWLLLLTAEALPSAALIQALLDFLATQPRPHLVLGRAWRVSTARWARLCRFGSRLEQESAIQEALREEGILDPAGEVSWVLLPRNALFGAPADLSAAPRVAADWLARRARESGWPVLDATWAAPLVRPRPPHPGRRPFRCQGALPLGGQDAPSISLLLVVERDCLRLGRESLLPTSTLPWHVVVREVTTDETNAAGVAAARPDDRIVVLDALTYAGNRATIAPLIERGRIHFVEGDIGDRQLVDGLLAQHAITHVAHLAAESHVDRSITGPGAFLATNVQGTFTLLEAFRAHWLAAGSPEHWRFLHVSTDEVFGSLDPSDPPFCETTPYSPRSPYAASKAASDHLARAWQHTYGLPVVVSNCSNNYGPFHFPEKLIPLTLINILLGRPIPVYGDGANVRDWLYVEDHCRALERILLAGAPGRTYCIGGCNEVANIDLVRMLCVLMDELAPQHGVPLPVAPSADLIRFVADRPGHDRRYAIDASRIRAELGWEPQVTVQEGLRRTVAWYLSHRGWWEPLLSAEYASYLESQYAGRLS